MNGQLLYGAGLAAWGIGSALAGVAWLALASAVAAAPFLVAGTVLALGGMRARREDTAGSLH